MRLLRKKRVATLAGVVVAAAALGVGIGFAASTVVTDTNTVRLRIIQSEFATGFDSGWHTHPGPVIVQVQKGYFRIFQGRCSPRIVGPGQTYLEIPLVPVRAVAEGRIKWTTSQILPNAVGDPTQTPVASPCD
jgi:quercetin dioxygenase-like cupin family protein